MNGHQRKMCGAGSSGCCRSSCSRVVIAGKPIGAANGGMCRRPTRWWCRSPWWSPCCRNTSRRPRRRRTATWSSARCSTRRAGPAPVAAAEAAKKRLQPGQFVLTGTLIVDGKATAFLRENAGGKSRRVAQGEQINGMMVADVKPDRVKLTLGEESEDLLLKVAAGPKTTTQPVVAAASRAPPARRRGRVRAAGRRATGPDDAGSACRAPSRATVRARPPLPRPPAGRRRSMRRRRAPICRQAGAAPASRGHTGRSALGGG